jgi:hypothetical protein
MRRGFLLFGCFCTISCLYPGSPFSTQLIPTTPVDYYSCLVGSKWVYEYKGSKEVQTYIVTAVSEGGGTKYVTVMQEEKGEIAPFEEIIVCAQGVFRVGSDGKKDEFPCCLLKLPERTGETWENEISDGRYPPMIKGRNEVMTNKGLEFVRVPAGIYRAIRIDCVDPVEFPVCLCGIPFTGKSSTWFAPDVGIVKQMVECSERVLISFTPGKADK